MKNFAHWPPGLPPHLELPQTSLYYNLEVAQRAISNARPSPTTATASAMPNSSIRLKRWPAICAPHAA